MTIMPYNKGQREQRIVPYRSEAGQAESVAQEQAAAPSTLKKVACVALKVILAVASIFACALLGLACTAIGKTFSLPFMSSMGSALSELTKNLMKKACKSNMFKYTNDNCLDLKRYFSYFGKKLFQATLGNLSQIGQEQAPATAVA